MEFMNNINPRAQVVFVGGGPTALCTAIQAKLRNPKLIIDILEKHGTYQRSHVLILNPRSFKGMPTDLDHRFKAIIDRFIATPVIPTNEIEDTLLDFAQKIGINICRNNHVTDPRDLRTRYPNARVIVGADGAHSTVRNTIFGNRMAIDKDLQFVIEVKYKVQGQGNRISFKEKWPTLKAMGAIAQEYVGRVVSVTDSTTGQSRMETPVTMRLFINEKSYKKMEAARARTPYSFTNANSLVDEVREHIRTWLGLRSDIIVPGSEKITVTRLGVYASERVALAELDPVTKIELIWCLVGDAAFGVPFFRSLNNGLLESTELARQIVEYLDPQPSSIDSLPSLKSDLPGPFARYSQYVYRLRRWEIMVARIKSFLLDFLLWFVRLSARVPWQVNFWTEAQVEEMKRRSPLPTGS